MTTHTSHPNLFKKNSKVCITMIVLTSLLNNILWKIGRHREGAIHIRLCEYLSVKDLKDTARFEVAATVSRRSRLLPLEMLAIYFSVFKYSITTDGKVSIILIQRYKPSILCVCICLYIRECVPLISIDRL